MGFKMDMLDDYLRAISRLLPRAKRDDITAELRDEILTRIEAKEEELGRPLTEDETEQLLRDFGHPIVVAARYRDGQQYSVGPALYPYWIFAVRFAVILEVCISALVFLGRVIGGGNVAQAFSNAIGSGVTGAMTLIGFATVAAWLIERKGITIGYFSTWRVRDLRFLDFAFWDWSDVGEWINNQSRYGKMAQAQAASGSTSEPGAWNYGHYYGGMWRQSSASRGVGAIAVGIVFILWWMGALSFGLKPIPVDFAGMDVNPGVFANLDYIALKATLFWPVLAYFAAVILFGIVVLVYPRGVRMRGVIDMAIGLSVMALAGWVWTASPIAEAVRVTSGDELGQRLGALVQHPVPIPLETVATVFLILFAFGGFCRAVGGLWEVLTGLPRYPRDGGAQAA